MPVDSEPQDGCDHSPNWVMVGKAKQGGGVKWVSTPLCQEEGQCLTTSLTWNAPTHMKRDLTTHRGVASYPPLKMMKIQNLQRNQN